MDDFDFYTWGLFVLANFAAATSGAVFTPGQWYEGLNKPSWRPPNWLFPPVWLVLYVVIGTSGWLVWRDTEPGTRMLPMTIYFVHLALNFLWSAIFFGLKRPGWAFCEIILLWSTLVAMMVVFYPINQTAALILIPYLCWVSFAGCLNFKVWELNKATLSNPV